MSFVASAASLSLVSTFNIPSLRLNKEEKESYLSSDDSTGASKWWTGRQGSIDQGRRGRPCFCLLFFLQRHPSSIWASHMNLPRRCRHHHQRGTAQIACVIIWWWWWWTGRRDRCVAYRANDTFSLDENNCRELLFNPSPMYSLYMWRPLQQHSKTIIYILNSRRWCFLVLFFGAAEKEALRATHPPTKHLGEKNIFMSI